MFCPKCGKGVQAGAAFCMHCGQGVAAQPAASQPVAAASKPMAAAPMMGRPAPAFPTPNAPSSKKTTVIAIGTALAMVLALFFGLRATGLLRFGASTPKIDNLKAEGNIPNQDLLRAEGQAPDNNLLKAEGSTSAAPVARHAEQIVMPDDIRKWLEHLEKIEKRKNDLSMKQLSQMAVLMQQMKVLGSGMGILNEEEGGFGGDTGPSETAKGSFDALRPEWNQLIADFRSYPPPAECRPIADDYFRAVSEIPGMNSDLAGILESIAGNPENAASALEKAMKIQNTSANVIDKNLKETDNKVGDICRKYETRKWFEIKTDVGGGLMGKFGM
jgi:hypothetical protein